MNEKTAPELPENWMWTRLGEMIDKVPLTGKKLKQKEYPIEGGEQIVLQKAMNGKNNKSKRRKTRGQKTR
ncbi:MAG: hypothetical protein U9N46_04110 [Euryarchaeota archaeon]|nr:hypothetical protein [Euryarchaeota archaeon]